MDRTPAASLLCLLCLLCPAVARGTTAAEALPSLAAHQDPAPADTSVQDTPLPNPFAGFETHHLSNGVKVWFKQLPGVPNVSVSAGIAVGSDADPPGKEQLAHFTEHMLFSDHDGRTEQEIKDAVEGIGGRRNGFTYSDHTYYYVTIGKEHGLFAIEWLAGILSPHEMDPAVVERGRQPVQNEIGVRPREIIDHLQALLTPAWLSPPDFWEREFGIERRRDPYPYVWRSLNGITPEDLRGFYERYYAPGGMTVTIVGDLDPAEALAVAERTFGSFPDRPVNRWVVELEDPGRSRSRYTWGPRATILYQSRHKLFDPTAEEVLTALFVRDLLNRRLGQRLRYGERKAVYGASLNLGQRGPAKFLLLDTRIDKEDYAFARGIIDEEIEFLRTGTFDAAEFEADRAAVVERLRSSNQTAQSLNSWTQNYFYDPATFADFPDVLSFYQNLTQEQVASFAREAFDESRSGPDRLATATLRSGSAGGRGRDAGVACPDAGWATPDEARRDEGNPVHRALPPAGGPARGVRHRPGGDPDRAGHAGGVRGQPNEPLGRIRGQLLAPDRRHRRRALRRVRGGPVVLRRAPAQAPPIHRPHPHQVPSLALPPAARRGHRRDLDPPLPRRLADPTDPPRAAARLRPAEARHPRAPAQGQKLLLPHTGHRGNGRGIG